MRIVRVRTPRGPRWGVEEKGGVRLLAGDPYEGVRRTRERVPPGRVRRLAPVVPSKIVAVGLNDRRHAEEMHKPLPSEPLLFLKPPSALIGPGEAIRLPSASHRVDHEVELGVVVGRRARRVPAARALQYVLGYTIVNDVTARDLQARDVQYTRAKGFDTFCPVGPWIETRLDPGGLSVRARINGDLRQDASTADLIFPVAEILSFASGVMTLLPGDLLSCGTFRGVGPLRPGDVVELEIEGIGTLRNPVRAAERARGI